MAEAAELRAGPLVLAGLGRLEPLSDFTTGSRSVFTNPEARLIQLNAAAFDAFKHSALPLVADAETLSISVKATAPAGTKPPTAVAVSVALGLIDTAPFATIFSKLLAELISDENPPVEEKLTPFCRLNVL